jgi:threonine dehydratase
MKTPVLTLETVRQARARIASGLRFTSCAYSARLSELGAMEIYTKRDFEQATGSFKERGARHALLALSSAQRSRGVVAASAGNHALGLAFHGGKLRVSVTVVMPRAAPLVKVNRCRELGAEVLLHGGSFDQAAAFAGELANRDGRTLVHPFDDLSVIAGQGTLALEVLEQVPDLDAVVVPVGGGGLLAGVSTVIKALRPDVEVIAVEPAHASGFTVAREVGRPVRVPVSPTLADGLAVAEVGSRAFAIASSQVDHSVTVTEDELAQAVLEIAERENCLVEGAAAAGLAACLSGKLKHLKGKRVVLLLTGRNIDPTVHTRALWQGWTSRELELARSREVVPV